MPLGIVDVEVETHLPGTAILIDKTGRGDISYLKHTVVKGENIVLVPQPSDDPNDPLNWPKWKKDSVFAVIFINTIILAAVPPPLLASSLTVLAEVFQRPLTQITLLSAYQVLVTAVLGPIVSALAHKFGKRPQFLFASAMGIIGGIACVVCGDSYNGLLAGRLLQGFGTTAYESLSLSVLGDIYFVHERASRTGLVVLTLTCMSSLVSIVSGPITNNLGWKYMVIINLPFVIAGAIGVFFWLPETQFRSTLPEQPTVQDMSEAHMKGISSEHVETPETESQPVYAKKTYVQSLAFTSGVYPGSFFKALAAPFVTAVNPAVIWAILVGGIPVGFYGTLAYILAQIWGAPPYNRNASEIGYFYVGALIGGFLGGVAGAKLCDASSNVLVKRNNGVFEAEFRIVIQALGAVLAAIGYFVFMWALKTNQPQAYYIGSVCHGLIAAGVTIVSTSSSLYIIDAHRGHATEIFVLSMCIKNYIFYSFSYFMSDWVTKSGPAIVFEVWGIATMGLLITNFPMYIFGKVNRQFVSKLQVLQNFSGVYS
ncbi:major facilitator superfamily domain-containing protein [Dactylonectria macrodidyma]|uniref:Major facilitator superfamily domain-containing protein n=1 Tax=Dactylonectria macrodidyma TaxID=307937 RepID=A0A9P9EVJ9_9HYPO|nr:major facilitator superfamily domain-containing protein [Dactylonectria macrodidyma]